MLNYFTQKKVFQEDMLFASLQTASRQVLLKGKYSIIMSDTVGFINQLPHHLVQAFRSTLAEVKEANLLVHVIDSSSNYSDQQIETTLNVLETLGVQDTPMIYVYNKIDKNKYTFIQPHEPSIYISVKEQINLKELEDLIIQTLFKDYELIELFIPYNQGSLFQAIQHKYEMVQEEYLEEGIYVSFFIDKKEKHLYENYIYKRIN